MKTIVVTGGSGGIGRGICIALAQEARLRGEPLRLAVHGSRESASLQAVVGELTDLSVEARAFTADLTDDNAVPRLIDEVAQWAGGLDAIVSNAGQSHPGKLADMTIEEWQRALDLNLRATWLLARAGFRELARSRGNIVAVASMSGLSPHPGYGAYSTAKAGLVMLCRQLAQEWAGEGIRVNAVCPGMIRTPLTEAVYEDGAVLSARQALVPLGRIGTAADVANAVAFLASERAAYITGAALLVDGGLSDGMLNLIPGRPAKRGD